MSEEEILAMLRNIVEGCRPEVVSAISEQELLDAAKFFASHPDYGTYLVGGIWRFKLECGQFRLLGDWLGSHCLHTP